MQDTVQGAENFFFLIKEGIAFATLEIISFREDNHKLYKEGRDWCSNRGTECNEVQVKENLIVSG